MWSQFFIAGAPPPPGTSVSGVLVSGVLVSGVLVSGVLVSGVLVSGGPGLREFPFDNTVQSLH